MNSVSLDPLLNELLSLTLSLKDAVLDDDREPEQWIDLLDKRQEIIDKLSELFEAGGSFTEAQKQTYLLPAYEADQSIAPIMRRKKQALEVQLANVRKSKAANQQYVEDGSSYSPYGAFFDQKK